MRADPDETLFFGELFHRHHPAHRACRLGVPTRHHVGRRGMGGFQGGLPKTGDAGPTLRQNRKRQSSTVVYDGPSHRRGRNSTPPRGMWDNGGMGREREMEVGREGGRGRIRKCRQRPPPTRCGSPGRLEMGKSAIRCFTFTPHLSLSWLILRHTPSTVIPSRIFSDLPMPSEHHGCLER